MSWCVFLYIYSEKPVCFCDGLNRGEIWEWLLFLIPVFSDRWVWNDQECHIQTQGKIWSPFDLKHITARYICYCVLPVQEAIWDSPSKQTPYGFILSIPFKCPKTKDTKLTAGKYSLREVSKAHFWRTDSEIKRKVRLERRLQISNVLVMVQMETQHHSAIPCLRH